MKKEKLKLFDAILIEEGRIYDCNYFSILPVHNFQWTQGFAYVNHM